MTEQDDDLKQYEAEALGRDEILAGGPVLGLDIDGVCVPVDQGMIGSRDLSPPGFLREPKIGMSGNPHWHPRLGEWLDRLGGAFAHVLWATSWLRMAGRLAHLAGSKKAVGWKCEAKPDLRLSPWSDGRVPPDTPVAVVDDRFTSTPHMLEWIAQRSAPTLVVVPNQRIGLGEALVRHLCAFAADPEGYRADHLFAMYGDPGLVWTGPDSDPAGWEVAGDLRPWRETDDPYYGRNNRW